MVSGQFDFAFWRGFFTTCGCCQVGEETFKVGEAPPLAGGGVLQ
jgi:hypothetical protein